MRLRNTANDTAPLRRTSVYDEPGGEFLGFVEFDEDGRARTTAELGEALAAQRDHIEISDRETSDPAAADEADEETEDEEE